MRTLISAALASLVLLPSAVSGVVEFASPEVAIQVTPAEIASHTGQQPGAIRLRALAVDPSGALHCYTQDNNFDPEAALVRFIPNGNGFSIETIATEAQILPHLDTTFLPPNVLSMAVDSRGVVYLHEYVESPDFDDDILRIVPGDPPKITSIWRGKGVCGIALDKAEENLLISRAERSFGAPRSELLALPLAGGEPRVVCTDEQIIAVTGREISTFRTSVGVCPDDRLIFFDEEFFGGSDHLMEILPSGEVQVLRQRDMIDEGSTLGVSSLGVDDHGNVYLWDEFPHNYRKALHILEDGGRGDHHLVEVQQIDNQLTALDHRQHRFNMLNYANAMAVTTDQDRVSVWMIDRDTYNIISISFPTPSSGD